ncbi:hypothetical protein [Muriicola jejuensis]|uniref:DNA topoisomerase IV n=1 Tax=Muriicola jejuensis TaxID=504488 RepID=A0A6P0UET7_9FLAO|nr:hypothetical protein [Muriicola jejuensis]NER11755.1 hypothetical protein [Muriicola jejuensis]
MNKIFIAITCFLILSCSGQKSCVDFRNGRFSLTSEVGTSFIERKENEQIETADGINYYADVEWINDCTYLLKNHRNHDKLIDKEEIGHIYKVEILQIFKDSIKIRTTANYTDFVVESTLQILE